MRFPQRPPAAQLTPEIVGRVLPHLSPTLPDGRYLHWDELRHRPPPEGLSSTDWWVAQSYARRVNRVSIPMMLDLNGENFWFCRLDAIDRATHELDRRDVARTLVEQLGDQQVKRQYRVDQLIEEAINSSVLEGAKLTTRAQAKAMIRDGTAPSSRGERMVMNNYLAMQKLLGMVPADLTLDDLLEIHAILGEDALDASDGAGRLRKRTENVRVEDAVTGDVWFVPPDADELPARLEQMLAFANDDDPTPFLHPVVRAIVLHFWLAYLHPFVDGNGRMARALFYWQMLRSGYDFAQYLSISGPIDRSPRSYYLAFAHTETDGGDLSYFLLHQLKVLKKATDDLLDHLRERSRRLNEVSAALENTGHLNSRQQAVLTYLVRNPKQWVTIAGHQKSHEVAYLTARKDLQVLEDLGHLRRVQIGKQHRYLPTEDFVRRIVGAR